MKQAILRARKGKAKWTSTENRMQPFGTYMALIIKLIVGQFEFIKTDNLPHPGVSRCQWVRVNIDPRRHRSVGISGYHPLGAVIHIPGRSKDGREKAVLLKEQIPPPLYFILFPCHPSNSIQDVRLFAQEGDNILCLSVMGLRWYLEILPYFCISVNPLFQLLPPESFAQLGSLIG